MSDYEIGYKKPPPEHRFRKGQSGNPAGRPRKPRPPISTDEAEIMRRLDAETVQVGGKSLTWREAEVHMLWGLAVSGNAKAKRLIEKLRLEAARSRQKGGVLHLPIEHWFKEKKDGNEK